MHSFSDMYMYLCLAWKLQKNFICYVIGHAYYLLIHSFIFCPFWHSFHDIFRAGRMLFPRFSHIVLFYSLCNHEQFNFQTMHTFLLSREVHSSRLITIMRQIRQLSHQNNLIRYNSVEIEAGFASISFITCITNNLNCLMKTPNCFLWKLQTTLIAVYSPAFL